jgi:hypothetical protein
MCRSRTIDIDIDIDITLTEFSTPGVFDFRACTVVVIVHSNLSTTPY